MRLSLKQLSDNDEDLWNEWVSASQNAHFFHLWEWGRFLSATYGYARYYFVVKCDGEIVGVLPLIYIPSKIFGNRLLSTPFCEYGGPLLSDSLNSTLTDATLRMLSKVLNKLMNELKVDCLELRHAPVSFSSFGFSTCRNYMTFEIDLTKEEEELWRNLDKKCRNMVRKAAKSGVKIVDVDDDNLSSYYNLYLSSQRRHGSPPHSKAFFSNLLQTFRKERLLRMILALYDDKAIGGVMVFCFNGKMDWWNNSIDRRYAGLNPTNLLLWEVIKWGKKNNFETFYLGRTRPQAKGLYHFKSAWGGKSVSLRDQVLSSKRIELPDPLQRKYVILSKIWSLLPQALAQRFGPSIISEIGM